MPTASPRAGRIPADPNRCHHLTLAGARCTMPTLYGRNLCYRHGHRDKVLRIKPQAPDKFPIAPMVSFVFMEDHESIMVNLNAIADAFSRHAIDHRQVSSLTYLMQTALKTLAQMNKIETKISAEEIARDVVYNDLGQPQAVPDPEPLPEPESQPEPQPGLPTNCHPEKQSNEEPGLSLPKAPAVVLEPATATEAPDRVQPGAPFKPGAGLSAPAPERPPFPPAAERSRVQQETTTNDIPQPTKIQMLKANADPNPNHSHTYENNKKQPQSFQIHAENKGEGGGVDR